MNLSPTKHIGIYLLLLFVLNCNFCLGQADSTSRFSLIVGAGIQGFNFHFWSPDGSNESLVESNENKIIERAALSMNLGLDCHFKKGWQAKFGTEIMSLTYHRKDIPHYYRIGQNNYKELHWVTKLGVGKELITSSFVTMSITTYLVYDRLPKENFKFGSYHSVEFMFKNLEKRAKIIFEPFYQQSFTMERQISNEVNSDIYIYGMKFKLKFAI